ncbi:MAG: hypothetical protein ACXACI_10945 [Candidatus Hodarchaeales archaeon]
MGSNTDSDEQLLPLLTFIGDYVRTMQPFARGFRLTLRKKVPKSEWDNFLRNLEKITDTKLWNVFLGPEEAYLSPDALESRWGLFWIRVDRFLKVQEQDDLISVEKAVMRFFESLAIPKGILDFPETDDPAPALEEINQPTPGLNPPKALKTREKP